MSAARSPRLNHHRPPEATRYPSAVAVHKRLLAAFRTPDVHTLLRRASVSQAAPPSSVPLSTRIGADERGDERGDEATCTAASRPSFVSALPLSAN